MVPNETLTPFQLEMARASMDLFRCCEELFEQTITSGDWPCNLPPAMYAEYFD
jgi:RNA exonuclease 4